MTSQSQVFGAVTNSLFSDSKSLTFPHQPDVGKVEKAILASLVKESPSLISSPVVGLLPPAEDVNDALKNHIMIQSKLANSHVAMSLQFNPGTNVTYDKNNFNLLQHNAGSAIVDQISGQDLSLVSTGSSLVPIVKSNNVSLGPDTAPMYRGHLKLEFTNGDKEYDSVNDGHHIILDDLSSDYNNHKAVNSTLMNLDSDAVNGFRGGFDNNFNSNDAFYTENLLTRDSNNKVRTNGNNMGNSGISVSNGISNSEDYNNLEVSVLNESSNNHPLFGSLKFVQDDASITVDPLSNVFNKNSTLSKLDSATNIDNVSQSLQTTDLPTTINENDLEALFSNQQLSNIGPGYQFSLTIGDSSLVQSMGGYDINNNYNTDVVPVYDASNNKTNGETVTLFNLDDSEIDENLLYMTQMKNLNLFQQHKFNVKNGTFEKNPLQSSNKNFDKFVVRDGLENLKVMSNNGIDDLTAPGVIKVFNTNNTLGDNYSRYTKLSASTSANSNVTSSNLNNINSAPVRRLLVNYESTESDHLSEVGVLSEKLAQNYYVDSEVHILTKSTMTDDNLWTTTKDVKMNDDSVLVFQDIPNSNLYSKSNVIEYNASGLNNFVPNDRFALLQINKTMNFQDSDESPMFKTSDNQSIDVISNVSFTNIDLNEINADDLRVKIYGKKDTDMPVINSTTLNINPWSWNVGNTTTGDLVTVGSGSSTTISNQNNSYLISEKNGAQYLGTDIYDVMKSSPNSLVTLTFSILTDVQAQPSKDVLNRRATVKMVLTGTVNKTVDVEIDDNDFKVIELSENTVLTSLTTQESLSSKILSNNQPVPSNYEVRKYITTKEYFAGIRNKVGPYKNLWVVQKVKEETTWFELFNKNKNAVMPDYYLMQITGKTSSGLTTGTQFYTSLRRFVTNNNTKVSSLVCNSVFRVKDFMGFTVAVEYRNGTVWNKFQLQTDNDYNYSLDPMFDLPTTVNLIKPGTSDVLFGSVLVTVDTPMFKQLGLSSHISNSNNSDNTMYMINISNSVGVNSFDVKGYTYSVAIDSMYLNKDLQWSPYGVGNNLFLQDSESNLIGTPIMNLVTLTELIDPTPLNTTNVNEVNRIKVTVKSGSTELLSFVSNKYVLENFNIIMTRQPIVQHDYKVGPLVNRVSNTEYLQCKDHESVTAGTFYAKLLYGENLNGVRVELNKSSIRLNRASFKLNGDRVRMSPLDVAVDSVNAYSGRYNNNLGEEILPSSVGRPLPTVSVVHRNIHPTCFRGLKNGENDIVIVRTMTTIKMIMGNKYQDDMNTHSSSNIGAVWKNRGSEGVYNKLEANDIRLVTVNGPQQNNMGISMNDPSPSIGTLGLKIVPNYSMFTRQISELLHQIPINVTPAQYRKVIVNPLNQTENVTVNSNVFDVLLHDFVPYDLVATRVKVYSSEFYSFKYEIPDMRVYHSPEYVAWDPANMTWTQIQTYSDAVLRNSVVIGNQDVSGVVQFKRILTHVSKHTKYCLLPRPIAYLESFDATLLANGSVTLPYNLSIYSRLRYYVDVNITYNTNVQGQLPSLQTHKPFDKNPAVGVPNVLNAVPSNKGLNNLVLGLNLMKYLTMKYNQLDDFSFTMSSNKLKIYNGVGISTNANAVVTKVFDGYISELDVQDKWHTELAPTINNVFTTNKKWNLNTRQLLGVLYNFINLPPNSLTDNYLFVNGITSFGLGTNYLNLELMDSVMARYYSLDYKYESGLVKITMYRLSSAEGINWNTDTQFQQMHIFCPSIYTKETSVLSLDLGNTLVDEPMDIASMVRSKIESLHQSGQLGNINWVVDPSFNSPKPCPIKLVPLSLRGAGSLNELLHVTLASPYKLLTSTRPPMLVVKSADGAIVTQINHDGQLFASRLGTSEIQLEPETSSTDGLVSNVGVEMFSSNIYPSIAF